jgi:hypothetical protein
MFKTPFLFLGALALVWLTATFANTGTWPPIAVAGIVVTLGVISLISRRQMRLGTLD